MSQQPPARRDLSLVLDAADADVELLGDRARAALGSDADALEELALRAVTAHEELPARLGTRPGQVNALVRLVLRPVDRTLTAEEANALRDRVYAALHDGPVHEWACTGPSLSPVRPPRAGPPAPPPPSAAGGRTAPPPPT